MVESRTYQLIDHRSHTGVLLTAAISTISFELRLFVAVATKRVSAACSYLLRPLGHDTSHVYTGPLPCRNHVRMHVDFLTLPVHSSEFAFE